MLRLRIFRANAAATVSRTAQSSPANILNVRPLAHALRGGFDERPHPAGRSYSIGIREAVFVPVSYLRESRGGFL